MVPGNGEPGDAGRLRDFRIAAILVAIGVSLVTAWEFFVLGWHPAREEPAAFEFHHLVRTAGCAAASAILTGLLWRCRETDLARGPGLARSVAAGIWLSAFTAAAFVCIFLVNPVTFHELAREDHAVEWITVWLLFGGSALFLASAVRQFRAIPPLDLLICLGFCGIYFVVAMEEISWMQRVFGYATPEAVAQHNWQAEFNLHNFQTDLAELLFYFGTGLFLVVLPLVGEALPSWQPVKRFARFIPGRFTAAMAAPMMLFTYGQWNLLPIQLLWFASLFVLAAFARTARTGLERALFIGMAVAVAAGEAVFLIQGHILIDVPDATEFKELFVGIGLACFAAEYWRGTGKWPRQPQA